ncbi:MAG TPA: GNAT family N-acetyltransferase, partial [Gemmatimonadaceae bacterium]|nr:GNAT family N-acetyltransferase [Gemmatimonadaceae bacterium]
SEWERWNAYVRAHPNGTVFHTTGWLNALSDDSRVFVDESDGEIAGGIALATTKRFGLTSYHIPPYTPYGGPLFGNEKIGYRCEGSTYNEFIQKIFAAVGPAGHLDFVLPTSDQDLLPYKWSGFDIGVGITYHLSDGDGALRNGALEKKINDGCRRQLKKLLRLHEAGTITATWDDRRDAVVDIQTQLASRKKFDPHGHTLRRLLERTEPGTFRSLLLTAEGEGDLAGCIGAVDEKRYYNLIVATRSNLSAEYRHIGVLMYYLIMRDALESGRTFDFEGSSIPGIAHFYRQMGGEQVPTFRLQKTRSPYYAALRFAKALRAARSG